MNTGFLGPAVTTVLTVYGIETLYPILLLTTWCQLQQYLPFTVLKLQGCTHCIDSNSRYNSTYRLRY